MMTTQHILITSTDGKQLLGVSPFEASDGLPDWRDAEVMLEASPPRIRWHGRVFYAMKGRLLPPVKSQSVLFWVQADQGNDPVTGLPGRMLFLQALREEAAAFERDGIERVLLFGDLDGFKQVNDTHGHTVGDTVLRIVARRLTHTVRRDDHVFRWGGDEFAVIARFPTASSRGCVREAVRLLSQKLREAIRRPIWVVVGTDERVRCEVDISIGCGYFGDLRLAHGNMDMDEWTERLVSFADRMMYREKRRHADQNSKAAVRPVPVSE